MNQSVYRINREVQSSISEEIFGFCLLDQFKTDITTNYDIIKKTVGSYLCLSNEGLDILIENLCKKYSEFVYKDDAGIRQLQFKNNTSEFKNYLLKKHYGLH
jgi:hypothetical protein